MPLKKDTPAVPSQGPKAAAAQTPPPVKPPAEKASAEAPPAEGVKRVLLCAVTYPIADPTTCIKYGTNQGMPADVKEGNWVDCQIKAGVLKEVQSPPTGEK